MSSSWSRDRYGTRQKGIGSLGIYFTCPACCGMSWRVTSDDGTVIKSWHYELRYLSTGAGRCKKRWSQKRYQRLIYPSEPCYFAAIISFDWASANAIGTSGCGRQTARRGEWKCSLSAVNGTSVPTSTQHWVAMTWGNVEDVVSKVGINYISR